MKTRLLYIIISLFLITACSKDGEKVTPVDKNLESFLANSIEGVYVNGTSKFVLNLGKHQVSANPTALTYRIQNDEQSVYIHFKLSTKPSLENKDVVVEVTSLGINGIEQSYSMTLEKEESKKIWLWNKENLTGFIVEM